MPFTFLADQAPVLPLTMRSPCCWDGLALVVGSMAPDLSYVTNGWGYGPLGIPLYFSGHRLQNQLVLALFAALLTIVVRRVVLPVAPLLLPDGAAPLRGALLATAARRPAWWVTYLSALVGALTHILIDGFTHLDGFAVGWIGFLREPLFSVAGQQVALYKVLQHTATVVLGIWCLILLRRWWSQSIPPPPDAELSRKGRIAVLAGAAAGMIAGTAVAIARSNVDEWRGRPLTLGFAAVLITWCWVAFGGLLAGCAVARPFLSRREAQVTTAAGPA